MTATATHRPRAAPAPRTRPRAARPSSCATRSPSPGAGSPRPSTPPRHSSTSRCSRSSSCCSSSTSSAARSPAARTTTCSSPCPECSCRPSCSRRRAPASGWPTTCPRASSTAFAACRSRAGRPLRRRDLADLVRYLTSGVIMLALGPVLGFRLRLSPLAVVAAFGLVMVFAFALCWVFTTLAMVVGQPRSVQGLGALDHVAAHLRQQRLRAHRHLTCGWLRGFVDINPVTTWRTPRGGCSPAGRWPHRSRRRW